MFIQVLGLFALNGKEQWPIVLALTGCFSVFNLITLPFCPESPRWLLINNNQPMIAREGQYVPRVAFLRVQGPPLDDLDPFRYTLKLTNRSDQNVMDPLNFTRHGMSKSFAELLTPKIDIVWCVQLDKGFRHSMSRKFKGSMKS